MTFPASKPEFDPPKCRCCLDRPTAHRDGLCHDCHESAEAWLIIRRNNLRRRASAEQLRKL